MQGTQLHKSPLLFMHQLYRLFLTHWCIVFCLGYILVLFVRFYILKLVLHRCPKLKNRSNQSFISQAILQLNKLGPYEFKVSAPLVWAFCNFFYYLLFNTKRSHLWPWFLAKTATVSLVLLFFFIHVTVRNAECVVCKVYSHCKWISSQAQ